MMYSYQICIIFYEYYYVKFKFYIISIVVFRTSEICHINWSKICKCIEKLFLAQLNL